MSAQPNQIATLEARPSVIRRVAERYGVDPDKMLMTLKATAFRGAGEVSNEQMMALLVVADAHGLNPWLKELYAFPSQNGIVPVVGVDGWAKLINGHPQFNGMDFEQDDEKCTCIIYRKDREHPTKITEYLAECKRGTGPWQTHPKRMLRHKALIQAARMAFSFAGIYDPDEAEAIVVAEGEVIDVTPPEERIQDTNFGPAKIGAVRMRTICEGAIAAANAGDAAALFEVWGTLTNAEIELVWKQLRSYERSAIKRVQATDAYKAVGVVPWSVELIAACKDPAALESAWKAIQDAFAEADAVVPADIETVYQDRKAELGGV
jgi:phage recombination protein Bet